MGRSVVKAFLDTYAMVDLLEGRDRFRPYLKDCVTNHFNLLEMHVQGCRVRDESIADVAFSRMRSAAIPIEADDVLAASRIKRMVKGASYADALGYAMAQRRKIPFITGDKAFRGLPGVLP